MTPITPKGNIESVRIVEVIEIEVIRGAGVEGDPIRPVYHYYDKNGIKLAERDPTVEPWFTP
jgi:hypothetical protein